MAEQTAGTMLTDPHASKLDPADPILKLPRPAARKLKRGPVMLIVSLVAATIIVAFGFAMQNQSGGDDSEAQAPTAPEPATVVVPESIMNAPETLAPVLPRLGAEVSSVVDGGAPVGDGAADLRLTARQEASEPSSQLAGIGPSAQLTETDQLRSQQALQARTAPILVSGFVDDGPGGQAEGRVAARAAPTPNFIEGEGRATKALEREHDPNLQVRKETFVREVGRQEGGRVLNQLEQPRSPFELKAGSIIPVVLVTGINSDLPGEVVGQVREHVYDTVTGNHLLVPQGSRVLARYDSMISYGQERVLVCWHRLIRPDGSSLNLECAPGADLAGRSGFADTVNHHWGRLILGVTLASFLGATAASSQGSPTGFQPTFPQLWAAQAGSQINQAGQQIAQRQLQIQPTIEIRPGFSVNVFVNKDLVLPPAGDPR